MILDYFGTKNPDNFLLPAKGKMKKFVVFGAGNIGRGFFAQLFFEAGYETVFVDINETIVNELNKRRGFTIKIVGAKEREISVKNVRAINGRDLAAVADELLNADLAATAVGVNVLNNICPALAAGIKLRADLGVTLPLNIIVGENMINAGAFVKQKVKTKLGPKYDDYIEEFAGFVETVLGRMIPVMPEALRSRDPLYIMVEEFCTLPIAKHSFKGKVPDIQNLLPAEQFLSFEERKLYIHNLGHSVCAYLGFLKKYEFIREAVEDKEIKKYVKGAMLETGRAIIKKHNLPEKEVLDYIDDLLERFANKSLGDTVARVGRDPVRKLGPEDRFAGSARLVAEFGFKPENISYGMAASLFFNPPDDEAAAKIQKILKDKGPGGVLKEITGLEPGNELYNKVIEKYNILKAKYSKGEA